jgi:hypothetical protein
MVQVRLNSASVLNEVQSSRNVCLPQGSSLHLFTDRGGLSAMCFPSYLAA